MRILSISILSLAILIGGYVYWWNFIADQALVEFEKWKQQQRANQIEVTHAPLSVEGFPYRIHLSAKFFALQKNNQTGQQPPKLTLTEAWAIVEPWNFRHVIFGTEGKINITSDAPNQTYSFDLIAEKAVGSASFKSTTELEKLAIDLVKPEFTSSNYGKGSADRVQLHLKQTQEKINEIGTNAPKSTYKDSEIWHVAVRGNQLTIDQLRNSVLGAQIEELSLLLETEATIKDFTTVDDLKKWRDRGGALEIQQANLKWNDSHFEGEGTLTLDEKNYPLGAFSTKIHGYNALVSTIAKAKNMTPKATQTTIYALNMLAKADEQGNRYVELPLSLQEGAAYIGPLKLFKLEPLFR